MCCLTTLEYSCPWLWDCSSRGMLGGSCGTPYPPGPRNGGLPTGGLPPGKHWVWRKPNGAIAGTHGGRDLVWGPLRESTYIRQRAAAAAHLARMALSLPTVSTADVASAPCITDIECQSIHPVNELMKGLVGGILDGPNLCHQLVLALTCSCSRWLPQLALVRPECNLCGEGGSDQIVIIIVVLY